MKKRGVKDGSCTVCGLTSGRTELLFTEIRALGRSRFEREIKEFSFGHVKFEMPS